MIDKKLKKIDIWKNKGLKIGVANGCFDLLHKGHKYLLKKSKQQSDKLIVLLNSDNSIQKIKGPDRPIEREIVRKKKLLKLGYVDDVIVFNKKTPLSIIKKIKPDFIFKGSDYIKKNIIGYNFIKKYGGKVKIIKLFKNYSTTNLIKNTNDKKNSR
jgi:rfaE bifunctional protein nucleotidyltransferase chain/domain